MMMFPIKASKFIYTHPRIFKFLHALGLITFRAKMVPEEWDTLQRYAKGQKKAVEIGTAMGGSAKVIAKSLASDGKLFCIDPWIPHKGKENPYLTVCRREMLRAGILDRIVFLQGFSKDMEPFLPEKIDFILIDGDHSYDSIKIDWGIVLRKLKKGGVVCLHDTTVPDDKPSSYLPYDSVRYFDEVIQHHPDFEWLECCYSMNVLRRIRA